MKEFQTVMSFPNPFRMTKTFNPRPIVKPQKSRKGGALLMIGMLGVIGVFIAFLWLTRQAAWIPEPFKSVLMTGIDDNRIFVASVDLDREGARELYREALTDLQESNYDAAISKFKRLEGVYPGLQDLLWLHEAEGYAGQGNEWAVQKKLNTLLEQQGDSPFRTVALYRIGQSHYRASEWEQAQQTFETVQKNAPDSDYALGSLYYLGALKARDEANSTQAAEPLKTYLEQCPNCKFSGEAAALLEKLLPQPTTEEHGLIGVAQAATSKDLKKTVAHLEAGPLKMTWLALGKIRIRTEQTQGGIQTLANGLRFAEDLEQVQAAVDLMLAHTTGDQSKINLLKSLNQQPLTLGKDYVLWKLATLDDTQSKNLYRQILQQYPKSDYAPESGWQLLWPLLSSGQKASYIEQAQRYLSHYPYSKSAPKVLFWIGKLLEKGQPSEATQTYERLLRQYPNNYYAFRSKGRLKVLAEGKSDPGWPTLTNRTDYPPAPTDLNMLDILPAANLFGTGDQGWYLWGKARELQRIGAADDMRLLTTEAMGEVPAAIESWAAQISGDRPRGLRAIRDGLEKQVRDSFIASGGKTVQPAGTTDELKLLYPVYFSDIISAAGSKNRLDPFLIQSLMREESYFNEFAISSSNARGLMQLLPSTAKEVAGWESLPSFQTGDLFSPSVNIRLGSRYLAHLHELFNGNSMPSVGAYNGGPNAMRRWVNTSGNFTSDPDMFVEKIPYEQSRDYIKKVFTSYWNYSRLYSQPAL